MTTSGFTSVFKEHSMQPYIRLMIEWHDNGKEAVTAPTMRVVKGTQLELKHKDTHNAKKEVQSSKKAKKSSRSRY